ncbi:MAG: hypothetical protein IPF99_41085 [Deltaproteobacteria bacterium]|nr:hypothetical protein [Deltaproteobacteria bacterium]MBP6833822.1 hypothetical protein [Deltaproteobacteria bacterium]
MGAKRVVVLVAGLWLGCTETAARPPSLPCPDGSSCSGSNPNTTGGGGGGGGGDGGAVTSDVGLSRYNVGGSVVVLDQLPPTATVSRTAVSGWTIRAVDDTTTTALTNPDGTFTLTGVLPTFADGGVPVIGVRAVSASRATFGAFREVRAGGGSVTLETFGSERVLEAVSGQGGAPSADLGHVAVLITEAADPSLGVSGVVIDASSASTTFYDSDLIPGQLTPSVAGTGARGFALVLNVPAGDDANGSSVTLRVQLTGGTPTPASVTVRVFPNTISWTAVRVSR